MATTQVLGTSVSSVDAPNSEYARMSDRWRTCRDVVEGSHAVHLGGTRYLPALTGHNAADPRDAYWGYNKRALFYSASGRTVDGLVGMVFRKPPVVEVPAGAEGIVDDVDLMGRSLEEFCRALVREVMVTGRAAVLVDHTRPPADPRPYFRLYPAEDVLDVVEDVIGGAVVPVQVRLRECYAAPEYPVGSEAGSPAEFDVEVVTQVRVLELVNGVYQQRVFRQDGERSSYELVDEVEPTVDATSVEFIPLWVFSSESARPAQIDPPPLIDLFEANLTHFRTEADYRNAIHIAGVPTLFVSGMERPDEPLHVGTAEVVYLPPADAKAYYVSYGAEGARAILESLDGLEQKMAFLGARMLQPDKRGIEAAETAAIHRQGEISILAALAGAINVRLTDALKFLLEWALFPSVEEAYVEVNTDFVPVATDPTTLTAMMSALQGGIISHETMWQFMAAGELVDPRKTSEDELKQIGKEKMEARAKQAALDKAFPPLVPMQPAGAPGGANGSTPPQQQQGQGQQGQQQPAPKPGQPPAKGTQ